MERLSQLVLEPFTQRLKHRHPMSRVKLVSRADDLALVVRVDLAAAAFQADRADPAAAASQVVKADLVAAASAVDRVDLAVAALAADRVAE